MSHSLPATRMPFTSERNLTMQDFDARLRMVHEHQARLRTERHVDRLARASAQVSHRPVRRRVGESLVRLGERVAGDGLGSPALTG